jgi:beta-glucanase (GH16 family)
VAARPALAPAPTRAPAPAAATTPLPVGVIGSWKLKFADEFNANKLDGSKWSTGWFGSGVTQAVDTADELNCYDPRQVGVAGGELDITAIAKPERCGGVLQPYATGLINSDGKFNFTYGAYEARVWLPGSNGKIADWPAIWADGQNWPDDGEIDVLEGLGGDPCYAFHYAGGDASGCASIAGTTSGWHTYAADWEPGSLTFYYDGKRVSQTTTGVTKAPMYLILNLSVSNTMAPPAVVPATMRVDYVRVWQHS